MPTGYTAAIAEGISFKQFTMSCARAFGALISMRDEPADAPIPEKLEPSSFYAQWLKESEARLSELDSMTAADAERASSAAFQNATEDRERYAAERRALKAKYDAMLAQVHAWVPPTTDHQGLKDFMIQQITESEKWDCGDFSDPPVRLSGAAWHTQELERAHREIERNRKSVQEEAERVASRNAWIKALRESLR